MAKKTNKTSHVLNLITNGAASEPETDKPSESVPAQGTGNSENSGQSVQRLSDAVAVMETAATEEHAAALRENAAALRESAAALREAVVTSEGMEEASPNPSSGDQDEDGQADKEMIPVSGNQEDGEDMPASGSQADSRDSFRESPSVPAEPVSDIKGMTGSPQPMSVPSGDKKVIVVKKSDENDKIANEILNQLTSHLEEEIKAKNLEMAANPKEDSPANPEEAIFGNPEEDSPGNPEEDSPGNPEEDSPGNPEEDSPGNPEEDSPGNPEEDSPGNPEEDNPGNPEEDNPGNPEEDNPGNPEGDSPGNPEEDNPGNPEGDSPDNPKEDNPGNPEVGGLANPVEAVPNQEVYRMVNVMEHILSHTNLEKEMKNYDVCMCSRCRADVRALTLTRLPAKYVVVDESSVAPIIGFYENKFKVRILTEVIKACMVVKEYPRHGGSVVTGYDKS